MNNAQDTEYQLINILINNNFECKVPSKRCDQDGNYIILTIEIEQTFKVTLVNIYGPNRDDPEFYKHPEREVTNLDSEHIIMCVDWNLVQDYNLDCFNYKQNNNTNARRTVINIKNRLNLQDPWRVYNLELRHYTWSRKNPTKKQDLISSLSQKK